MNHDTDILHETRVNLIGAGCAFQHVTGTAASITPIPGGDRVIAIGTPAQVRGLLAADGVPDAAHADDPSLRADEATRLRRVVRLLEIDHQVPGSDASLRDCLFSVLGLIARKIEDMRTQQDAAPADALAPAAYQERTEG